MTNFDMEFIVLLGFFLVGALLGFFLVGALLGTVWGSWKTNRLWVKDVQAAFDEATRKIEKNDR